MTVHRRKFEALTSRLASWRSPLVLFLGERAVGAECFEGIPIPQLSPGWPVWLF